MKLRSSRDFVRYTEESPSFNVRKEILETSQYGEEIVSQNIIFPDLEHTFILFSSYRVLHLQNISNVAIYGDVIVFSEYSSGFFQPVKNDVNV